MCLDANASPGEQEGSYVCQPGFPTSSGTPLLRAFQHDWHLHAPITGTVHEGTTCTWTSPNDTEHTIDYVLIPIIWAHSCTMSRVVEEFDLGNLSLDHSAVAIELKWQQTGTHSTGSHRPADSFDRSRIAHQLRHSLKVGPVADWTTDVEQHLQGINGHLRHQLARSCPRRGKGPVKPYINDELWNLRKVKLFRRQKLKQCRNLLRRETLARVFLAWRSPNEWSSFASFVYGSTLRIGTLKHGLGFRRVAISLKRHLVTARQRALQQVVTQFTSSTSSAEIQQMLRPFLGPRKRGQQGLAPLPFIRDARGRPCATAHEVVDRWTQFFCDMEGGQRMTEAQLRERWLHNLAQLRAETCQVSITEMPSLCELEQACRRTAGGKASGLDGIPSELMKHCPAAMAKMLYSLLLKIGLHGQEPLEHKGGLLVPIWKGKLSRDLCEAFRSILISSSIGKTIHRALRTKQSSIYHAYLHRQQIGGRKGISVSLGCHMIRAFQRSFHAKGQPTAVLFVDLQEAFYRVVRPLAIAGEWDDELIAQMAQRLQLDHLVLHDLRQHLRECSATEEAGLSVVARKAILALHTDTFFVVQGQQDRTRTRHGSRPGDSYADVVFGYLMARVLKHFEAAIAPLEILTDFPAENSIDLHETGDRATVERTTFVGPCWMDDLAIPLTATTNDSLIQQVKIATGLLLDTFRAHAMTPNLQRGKTEILIHPKGPGSHRVKKDLFGPCSSGKLSFLGEYGMYKVSVVTTYSHLGGLTHYTGDLRKEVRRRIAIAHQSFNQYRRVLFQNRTLPMTKRAEIFTCLILSRLLYGSESWVLSDLHTKSYLHSAVMRLYKRLLGGTSDAHYSDAEVLHLTGLPDPAILLRLRRLSYLGSLLTSGTVAHWGLLNRDHSWLALIRDDLQWTWDQLCSSCDLGNPKEHTSRWIEIIVFHRGYWRRLLRRARQHAILANSRNFVCLATHIAVRERLTETGHWPSSSGQHAQHIPAQPVFGCMSCGLRCKSRAGEGAHMNKTHKQPHPVRRLIATTQCEGCLKEYFTHGKLKAHLIRSAPCRSHLLRRQRSVLPLPGIGSQEDENRHSLHDGRLPPLQAEGPRLPPGHTIDFVIEHVELYEQISLAIVENDGTDFQRFEHIVRNLITDTAISWSQCCSTLQVLVAELAAENNQEAIPAAPTFMLTLQGLQDPASWQFLRDTVPSKPMPTTLCSLEAEFDSVELCQPGVTIDRPVSKDCIFLHVFSGRRRQGDLQFYMEETFPTGAPPGTSLHVVSLDVIIDSSWGNVRNTATQRFWLEGVRQGWVLGALLGPPCETWSQARFNAISALHRRAPRPLRSWDRLWGLDSLSLREAEQVDVGNELLLFSLSLMFELALAQRTGVLEHPREPADEAKPSIWRLPIIRVLLQMPGVALQGLSQGLWGAATPKPRNFLMINLPHLPAALRRHQIAQQLPARSAVGLNAEGTWNTTSLKEYPPALNRGLAQAFCHTMWASAFSTELKVEEGFLLRCRAMTNQSYGDFIGPDFSR